MERIKICVLFRIRIQNMCTLSLPLPNFQQFHCHKSITTILFFPPPIFGNNIATNQLLPFFFSLISAILLPQINCHNFFSFHFRANLLFFFPSFSETSLPKLLLNFSPRFWQLGCHSSLFFFLLIFGNLVATILIFSLLTPLQFRQLGCHN